MKNILTASGLIATLSVLNNIDLAIDITANRMKEVADILEKIDNNLEVEVNKK